MGRLGVLGLTVVPLIGVWTVLGSQRVEATTMVKVPLAELAQSADAVVQARVERTGQFVRVVEGHVEASTRIDLQVNEWLRGRGGARIHLYERGGVLPDGTELVVAGAPHYRTGEQVIAFLRQQDDGSWQTHNLSQGKFEVLVGARRQDTTVRRDLRDAVMVDESGVPSPGTIETLSLSELLSAVRPTLPADTTGRVLP